MTYTDRIVEIVDEWFQAEPTMERQQNMRRLYLIRDLLAADRIAALRVEFAEAHAGGASSNDIAQLLDDFLVAHGQPTVLYAKG